MRATDQTGYRDPQAGGAPMGMDDPLARVFAMQEPPRPWFVTLFRNLRDVISPPKLPPLYVTSRPLSEEEMSRGEGGFMHGAMVIEQSTEPWFKSLISNIKELFNPPKLPPLQITSRPLTEEEIRRGDDRLARAVDIGRDARPWYATIFANIREAIHPTPLPPLEVTSKPVAVRDIWGKAEYQSRSQLTSVVIHVGLVVLAFTLGTNRHVQQAVKNTVQVFAPDIAPFVPDAKPKQQAMGGGGGGGDRSPLPPSKGRLPRQALKQFTPPTAVIQNPNPRLVMEPTIIVPTDIQLPNVNIPNYGDPLARLGPPSNGPGSGGGIGTGSGGGVGSGRGGGFGPGEGGGVGGGAFRIGGGVSAPVVVFKVEPEYSEEARKAKYQGTVLLAIVVDADGKTRDIRVLRSLGMGLDEKAIEAVSKWRFRPGYKDGRPVPVQANVEVNFRLL